MKAEICATLIDENGAVVGSVAERSLAVSTEQLRRIPEVIAVAGGTSKTGAVAAALRSGIVDSW